MSSRRLEDVLAAGIAEKMRIRAATGMMAEAEVEDPPSKPDSVLYKSDTPFAPSPPDNSNYSDADAEMETPSSPSTTIEFDFEKLDMTEEHRQELRAWMVFFGWETYDKASRVSLLKREASKGEEEEGDDARPAVVQKTSTDAGAGAVYDVAPTSAPRQPPTAEQRSDAQQGRELNRLADSVIFSMTGEAERRFVVNLLAQSSLSNPAFTTMVKKQCRRIGIQTAKELASPSEQQHMQDYRDAAMNAGYLNADEFRDSLEPLSFHKMVRRIAFPGEQDAPDRVNVNPRRNGNEARNALSDVLLRYGDHEAVKYFMADQQPAPQPDQQPAAAAAVGSVALESNETRIGQPFAAGDHTDARFSNDCGPQSLFALYTDPMFLFRDQGPQQPSPNSGTVASFPATYATYRKDPFRIKIGSDETPRYPLLWTAVSFRDEPNPTFVKVNSPGSIPFPLRDRMSRHFLFMTGIVVKAAERSNNDKVKEIDSFLRRAFVNDAGAAADNSLVECVANHIRFDTSGRIYDDPNNSQTLVDHTLREFCRLSNAASEQEQGSSDERLTKITNMIREVTNLLNGVTQDGDDRRPAKFDGSLPGRPKDALQQQLACVEVCKKVVSIVFHACFCSDVTWFGRSVLHVLTFRAVLGRDGFLGESPSVFFTDSQDVETQTAATIQRYRQNWVQQLYNRYATFENGRYMIFALVAASGLTWSYFFAPDEPFAFDIDNPERWNNRVLYFRRDVRAMFILAATAAGQTLQFLTDDWVLVAAVAAVGVGGVVYYRTRPYRTEAGVLRLPNP